jgi:NAD-dependent dihydropyrimidine dehydrogenase PreA subunit
MVRDGKKQVMFATPTTVTLVDYPPPGRPFGEPCTFRPGEYRGDQTTSYHLEIVHRDGTRENHRIIGNDRDTLMIGELDAASGEPVKGGRFAKEPVRGAVAVINLEFKVPKIDTELCIGCGLCEMECPVVGDRRAVYVTAEGETRSQNYLERERNRSIRLMKTADARQRDENVMSLTSMIAAATAPPTRSSGGCCGGATGGSGGCGCASKAAPASPTRQHAACDAGHVVDLRQFLS